MISAFFSSSYCLGSAATLRKIMTYQLTPLITNIGCAVAWFSIFVGAAQQKILPNGWEKKTHMKGLILARGASLHRMPYRGSCKARVDLVQVSTNTGCVHKQWLCPQTVQKQWLCPQTVHRQCPHYNIMAGTKTWLFVGGWESIKAPPKCCLFQVNSVRYTLPPAF